VIKCDAPERYRWGKSPPDYRGLRKTWITDDLSRKSRTQIKAAEVTVSPLPSLGLKGVKASGDAAEPVKDAGTDGGTEAANAKASGCGCRTPGRAPEYGSLAAFVLLGLSSFRWRRRARRVR